MSERARIIAIFGVVAVVLGGGLFYYFKIHAPKEARGAAQAEVTAWEARWTEARTCLLGKTPASSKAGEALAVRELSPDPWERKTCTKLIGKLNRGIAEDTGMMDVEHAWMSIDRAAAKVASAFATHVDPFGEAPENRGKESPLPEALEALDAAHADLRKVVGMSPPPHMQQAALPAAEIIALKLDIDPVTSLDSWLLPSSAGTVGFGSIKNKGQVQVVLVAGAAPKLTKIPAGALRAVPGGEWGAAGLFSEISIAPIDDKGAFGTMTRLPVPNGARVLFTAGTFADGVVAFTSFNGDPETGRGTNGITFARSANGTFTADKPIPYNASAFAIDPAGRSLVAWSTDDGAMRGVIAKSGAAPKIVELGSGYPGYACMTAKHGWVGGESQYVSFDEAGVATPHVLQQHELLGCTADVALLHKLATSNFVVCKESCRVADLPNMRSTNIATVANDKVVAIRNREHVLGVYREGAAPVFFTTPATLKPILATSNGKVIDILADTDEGVVIARIPAN